MEEQANLVPLTPTDKPAIVGVEKRPNRMGGTGCVVGEPDGASSSPSPPVARRNHTEGANGVEPQGLIQDFSGKVVPSRFQARTTSHSRGLEDLASLSRLFCRARFAAAAADPLIWQAWRPQSHFSTATRRWAFVMSYLSEK